MMHGPINIRFSLHGNWRSSATHSLEHCITYRMCHKETSSESSEASCVDTSFDVQNIVHNAGVPTPRSAGHAWLSMVYYAACGHICKLWICILQKLFCTSSDEMYHSFWFLHKRTNCRISAVAFATKAWTPLVHTVEDGCSRLLWYVRIFLSFDL